jgi:type IV secretory pathway component VirB8
MFGSKEKKTPAKSAPVTTTGDDLGKYPGDIDNSPTRQRVLERAMRLMTIGLGASALINVALTALVISIFPLKQVYPYLVTFREGDEQVVALQPLMEDAPGIQFASEANVRQYVKQRHTFAPVNSFMDMQWGPDSQLAAMTAPEQYAKFETAAQLERSQMMTAGYTRQIEIESATMIEPGTWQVAFTTIDSLGGNGGTLTANPSTSITSEQPGQPSVAAVAPATQSSTKRWLATMTVVYEPQMVSYDERLLNPLGFTVTDYSVVARS